MRILPKAGPRTLLWAVLLTMLLPGGARAAIPLALYPVQGPATEQSRSGVRDLIAAGLQMTAHQQVFAARKPLVAPEKCGPKVTVQCLAGLADKGAIVYAVAHDKDSVVEVTLLLVTADGKRAHPIQFENNRFFQDDRLAGRVVEALEDSYRQLGAAPPAVAVAAPAPAPVPASTPAPPAVPTPSPAPAPAPRAKADLVPQPEPPAASVESDLALQPPSSSWMTKAAIGCGAGGALVFGGGVVFGLLAKNLNQDLTDRYKSGTLVAADSAKYSRLKTYDGVATAMLIGGGALAAAGLTFWALSPSVGASSHGGSISIEGSF